IKKINGDDPFIFLFARLNKRIVGWVSMIKTLSKSIRQYKKLSLLSPMFVIGEVIIEMLITYLIGILIDNGIMKGDMSYISEMGLLLLVLTIISLILGASASYVSAHAAAGFAANLRQDMFYHMQDYSFENIDRSEEHTSELQSR